MVATGAQASARLSLKRRKELCNKNSFLPLACQISLVRGDIGGWGGAGISRTCPPDPSFGKIFASGSFQASCDLTVSLPSPPPSKSSPNSSSPLSALCEGL